MLLDFKFKNFMSFADECKFTMLANKDKSHECDLIEYKKERVSKARMLYGANASGKSSFIHAINFVLWFIRYSNMLPEGAPIDLKPFKFRSNAYEVPSEFSLTFVTDDIRYIYAFSCTNRKVINERLDAFYSSKPTNIFERINTNEYIFRKDVKRLKDISEKNTANKLFLVTSATWNYDKTKAVVDYLMNNIEVSYNINTMPMWNFDKIINDNVLDDYKKFCLNLLNNADISIGDFFVDSKKMKDIDNNLVLEPARRTANGDDKEIDRIANSNAYSFHTVHKVNGDGGSAEYTLDLSEESLGTVQFFKLSPLLYYVFRYGKTLFVDEIDKSLHPMLVEHIVKLFLNPETNPNNAQLIANTHDTNLLDLELFRRDDIWFTERDISSGRSEMYSLADFSPRKDENIERSYLLGRYGAVPFIKE